MLPTYRESYDVSLYDYLHRFITDCNDAELYAERYSVTLDQVNWCLPMLAEIDKMSETQFRKYVYHEEDTKNIGKYCDFSGFFAKFDELDCNARGVLFKRLNPLYKTNPTGRTIAKVIG